MTKIDIFSGFLGAGKTTLIKKLIKEAYAGEKLVLIENEFGEIGIDGGFLKEAGIEITEMNSGCICCSLVGDFGKALKKVLKDFSPDRILIEPSGVGKLSDVIRAVQGINASDAVLNGFTTVADVNKCKMYMKNFGEFFNDQIEHAGCIILSHTQNAKEEKIQEAVALLRSHNKNAVIVTTPWSKLDGSKILEAMERKSTLESVIAELESEHEHHHEHDHHDHEHHHEHEHEHEHHHEHDESCTCGCCGHDHEHHHEHDHHHADEVFTSWGEETTKKYTPQEIESALKELENSEKYGMVLRAKGMVENSDGENWIHFDYIPGEWDIREGGADITGRLCVIGSKLNKDEIAKLFSVQ